MEHERRNCIVQLCSTLALDRDISYEGAVTHDVLQGSIAQCHPLISSLLIKKPLLYIVSTTIDTAGRGMPTEDEDAIVVSYALGKVDVTLVAVSL